MPGRHSGGSGLGRGSGGMRGGMGGMRGGMGGGFRGGMGGGFRGGFGGPGMGWGGGWRGGMGGGWGWRRPMGWGWFMPWSWFGGGGMGCAIFPIVLVILVFIGIASSFNFGGYQGNNNFNNNGNFNNNNDIGGVTSNSSGSANLADEPAAVQTQTAKDLVELHAAFDSRISQWQQDVRNNENLSVPAADAGLTQDNNTQIVLYGKCGSALYIYVIANTKPDTGPANGEGYVYTLASSPGACHPPQWTVYDSEDVGGGWYFATLQSVN